MRKLILFFTLCAVSAPAWCEETWLGLYLQGTKIGYAYSASKKTDFEHQPAEKNYSATIMSPNLLGQEMTTKVYSWSWTDLHGRPLFMRFDVESAGRSQKVDARFTGGKINVSIDNSGEKSSDTIVIPKGASVVDDAVEAVLEKGAPVGKQIYYYVLDPLTVSLIKTQVTMEGKATTQVHGMSVIGTKIEISEPRSTSYCYLTAKGDLIKLDGPMGIEMFPESQREALVMPSPGSGGSTDLAYDTCLTPDKPINDVRSIKELDLRITGHDLSDLPSDDHQTITKSGDAWLVSVHPVHFAADAATISRAAREKTEWLKPSLDIPSDKAEFVQLAAKLTQGCSTVPEAAQKIHDFVFHTMKPDAGIGVLRDATEILKTKEGVCRDYAVLTATLLRAAHIPAKLVSGLEYAEGSFYYHAWAEVWDGSHWVGVDSTIPNGNLTAGHIQLAQGDIQQAFTFTFLDKAKVEVLDARRT